MFGPDGFNLDLAFTLYAKTLEPTQRRTRSMKPTTAGLQGADLVNFAFSGILILFGAIVAVYMLFN